MTCRLAWWGERGSMGVIFSPPTSASITWLAWENSSFKGNEHARERIYHQDQPITTCPASWVAWMDASLSSQGLSLTSWRGSNTEGPLLFIQQIFLELLLWVGCHAKDQRQTEMAAIWLRHPLWPHSHPQPLLPSIQQPFWLFLRGAKPLPGASPDFPGLLGLLSKTALLTLWKKVDLEVKRSEFYFWSC